MVHTSKDILVSINACFTRSLHGPLLFLYPHFSFLYGPVSTSKRASKFWSSTEHLLILSGQSVIYENKITFINLFQVILPHRRICSFIVYIIHQHNEMLKILTIGTSYLPLEHTQLSIFYFPCTVGWQHFTWMQKMAIFAISPALILHPFC